MLHEGTQRRRGEPAEEYGVACSSDELSQAPPPGKQHAGIEHRRVRVDHDRDQARRTQALRFEAERHDAATPERARDAEETIDRVQSTATRSAETVVEGRLQSRQRVHGSPCVVRRPATVILQRNSPRSPAVSESACVGMERHGELAPAMRRAIARHGASRDSSARTSATDRTSTPVEAASAPGNPGCAYRTGARRGRAKACGKSAQEERPTDHDRA